MSTETNTRTYASTLQVALKTIFLILQVVIQLLNWRKSGLPNQALSSSIDTDLHTARERTQELLSRKGRGQEAFIQEGILAPDTQARDRREQGLNARMLTR